MRKDQLNLGEFIARLAKMPPRSTVHFDFVYFRPGRFTSYRGHYDQLALTYSKDDEIFVEDLIAEAREAVGKQFTGWKGGTYTMHENTPLWVANAGESGGTAIVDVIDAEGRVVIETGMVE